MNHRFKTVLFVLGLMLGILSMLMLVPLLFGDSDGDQRAFFLSSLITVVCGLGLVWLGRGHQGDMAPPQIFILTVASWVTICAFSGLPLFLSKLDVGLTDAVFESVSGVTTTGATVLTGLDTLPREILLWRSLMQWLGGIGIIAMAVAILPFLRVGGMRLFQAESSDWSEKALPRASRIVKWLLLVYVSLTAMCFICYLFAGMDWFNALNHAMTTSATGGFSTSDQSLGQFDSQLILWVGIVFMALGALPFVLYVRMLVNHERGLFLRDAQVRGFLAIVVVGILTLAAWRAIATNVGFWEGFTDAAFNTMSIATTTGYASTDYTLWGQFAILFFFFLAFLGGCSGSTTGGMKIFRFQLSWILLREQILRLVHPSAVFPRKYNNRRISDEVIASAIAFSFVFFISVFIVTMALAFFGLDIMTCLSGAVAALANVGPGLGPIIGPAGNYSELPDAAKWVLAMAMIFGRLEMLSVVVLMNPQFWRQ
jgi:trk system potassium uptake protein TrkH